MEKRNKTARCAVYARVSTVDKQDTFSQIQSLIDTAKQSGYNESQIEIYQEKVSGFKKKEDRPELTKLLTKVEANPKYYDIIYLQEISRISRDFGETARIFTLFTEIKQQVYIKSKNILLLDENGNRSMAAGMMIWLLAEMATEEARQFRERSSRGLYAAASKGKALGGAYMAFGYTKDDKGYLVIDKEEAKVVKQIYQLYQKGLGCSRVAQHLNDHGIQTRSAKVHGEKRINFREDKKKGNSITWCDVTIRGILTNPIYIGQRRIKEKFVEAPAIIDQKQFDEVQLMLKTKYRTPANIVHPYLLKDVEFKCGCCNRNMIGRYKPVPGGDNIYCCVSNFLRDKEYCGNSINIDYIENALATVLGSEKRFDRYLNDHDDFKSRVKKDIQLLELEIVRLGKKREKKQLEPARYKRLYVEGIDTLEDYKANLELINKQLDDLKQKELAATKRLKELQTQLKNIGQLFSIQKMNDLKMKRDFFGGFFKSFIEHITISPVSHRESRVIVKFKKGLQFAMLLDRGQMRSKQKRPIYFWLIGSFNRSILKFTEGENDSEVIKIGKEKGELIEMERSKMFSIKS